MINGNRVDFKDNAIDQMPFGFISSGVTPTTNGCLVQHGDWHRRTVYPPENFWNYASISGIGNCFPLSELPGDKSGSISDLKIDSQKDAFYDLISELKKDTLEDDK